MGRPRQTQSDEFLEYTKELEKILFDSEDLIAD
jgi:hypothetical protein